MHKSDANVKIPNTRLTKNFVAIFALAERLPASASLMWIYTLSRLSIENIMPATNLPQNHQKQLSFSTAWYLSSTEICVTVLRKYVVLRINAPSNTHSCCTMLDTVTVPLFLYLIWQIWQSCVIVSRADLSIQSPCPRPNLILYKASAQADCLSKNHIYRVAIPHLSLHDNCSITYSVRNAFFDKVCNKQDKTVMNILVQFGF